MSMPFGSAPAPIPDKHRPHSSETGVNHDFSFVETPLYFAYGSNLNRVARARRCPESRPVAPAVLEGWQLTFQGVADIEPNQPANTYGAVWRITDGDLERLDQYEGYPALYGRELITVRLCDES